MSKPPSEDALYSATQLAKAFSITARTLRFYEAKGLLAPRRVGARRVYSDRDRARLVLILRAKRLGFSLAEIKEYLDLYAADASKVSQLRRLAVAVEARIDALHEQRLALEATLCELEDILRQTHDALRQRGVHATPT